MRISDRQRHEIFTADIQQRLANLMRIEQELASGKSLLAPSEGITRAGDAMRADEALAETNQHTRNIDDAKSWIGVTESKLQSIVELLNEVDALAVAADNDSQTADDRRDIALQIDQKLEALTSLVNANSGDRYLFGGHGTTVAPFQFLRDENGRIIGASADSDTIAGKSYRRIGSGEDVQVNIPGSQVFQPIGQAGTAEDLFYVISSLRDTVGNNNEPPPGEEETRSNPILRDRLDDIRERIVSAQSYLGAVGQRLDAGKNRLSEERIQLTNRLENAQGVEMTDLVSRLATEEGAYNALLGLRSMILQQSLVDYIR